MELVKYNAACKAIAEAKNTDEVKNILNVSEAMRAYAVQANNLQLEVDALAIKARAKRKLGDMIQKQKETVGLNTGTAGLGRPDLGGTRKELPKTPTLADIGNAVNGWRRTLNKVGSEGTNIKKWQSHKT